MQGFRLVGATAAAGVSVDGAGNVTLRDLNITGPSLGVVINGVSSNVTLSGVTVNRTYNQGLLLYSSSSVSGLVVRDSVFDSTGASAIEKYYASTLDVLRLENVTVVNATGHGVFLRAYNYYGYFVRNVVVNNTTIRDCSQDGLRVVMEPNSENVTVGNSTFSGNRQHGAYFESRGLLLLDDNVFSGNGFGGGVDGYYGLRVVGDNVAGFVLSGGNRFVGNRNGVYLRRVGGESAPVILSGSQLTDNAGYPVVFEGVAFVTVRDAVFDDAAARVATGFGIQRGVLIRGASSNVTVSGVTVNRTSQQGLMVDAGASVSGLVVRDSVFDSTGASGIEKDYSSSVDVLRLENVTVVNATGHGVFLRAYNYYGYFVRNVVVNNTTIRDCSQDGLRITMETNSENATIINLTSTNNRGSGLYAELRGNNTLENSTFSNNTNWGIWLTGQNNPKLTFQRNNAYNNSAGGIYLRNINNITINGSESVIKDNGGNCLELQNADGVTVEGLVFGNGVRQFNYGVVAVDCDDLVLRGLSIGNSTLQGVRVGGTASNVTLVGVNVTGSGQQGLYLVEGSTLRNVTVDDSWFVNCSDGIRRVSWSWGGFLDGITIRNSHVVNSRGYGVFLEGYNTLRNVVLDNLTVTGSRGHGVYVTMSAADSGNLTVKNTTISDSNGVGLYLVDVREAVTLRDNTVSSSTDWGLWLRGVDSPELTIQNNTLTSNSRGMYLQGVTGSEFIDNTITSTTGPDLQADPDTSNTFTRLRVGLLYPTLLSFRYTAGIILREVESPPADPAGWVNITKYVDISSAGATILDYLRFHYTPGDVAGKNETGLRVFRHSGTWNQLPETGVNTTERYVYADNINTFSTFAPLTEKYPTTTTLQGAQAVAGEIAELVATLTSPVGPVEGREIRFYLEGVLLGSALTDNTGKARFTTTAGAPGTYATRAEFPGDDTHLPSEDTSTLKVLKPATFNLDNLKVTPDTGVAPLRVNVTVNVTNTGEVAGVCRVNLTVNGVVVAFRDITLNPASSAEVSFLRDLTDPGVYTVGVDGLAPVAVTVLKPATFVLDNLEVDPVTGLEPLNVNVAVDVTNTGDVAGDYTASLMVNGAVVSQRTLTVNAGETVRVTFTRVLSRGTYNVTVDGLAPVAVTVLKPATFQLSNLRVSPVSGPSPLGITVTVRVTNTGDLAGSYPADLMINGVKVDSRIVNLNGGESTTLTYTRTLSAGTYRVTVDTLPPITVTVTSSGITAEQVISAARYITWYYGKYRRLPGTVRIAGRNYSPPEVLDILVRTAINLAAGSKRPVTPRAVGYPTAPKGIYMPGKLYMSAYLRYAVNIRDFITRNRRAPNYAVTSRGRVPYSRLVFMYSRILGFYGASGRLPQYVVI
ncbi:right-handed parallel beta-helix repeat-containing protein [Methanothermobacter sp.]|uniref:right-handed parallel beta-helix repeat-containing protein n=1 Tax=Methanothermobacter sp. TaxID=1884223 RepID=UPI0026143283|nr:right-handed parallel beta-helix repeat-containing protein [Methanothermobacter sp.]MDI9615110.1 right-handed parallel beta-helix repeat-containing protein [Methanothermobacter sp.]